MWNWNIFSKSIPPTDAPMLDVSGQIDPQPIPLPRIPWHLTVLCLDKIDEVEKAHIPLKEVTKFMARYSRFDLKITFMTFNDPHGWNGPTADNRYNLHWSILPQKWLNTIQPCTAVLALYKLLGRDPVHGGDTWGLPYGIPINGKLRPFSSIPTDLWYYQNTPFGGFQSWAAQICAHEVINGIQGKLEAAPYMCGQLVGAPGDSWTYESARLQSIGAGCYGRLGQNED